MNQKKKLIEVALPLELINVASAREKSIRHGHPSTLHLWWARRPLAAARAVIFAQMVDDPSSHPDLFPTEKAQKKERDRLFKIIEDLVLWENTTNEDVLQRARDEIWNSWRRTCAENADHPRAEQLFDRRKLPAFHDPFSGGGTLPLEAQRLGLEAFASDLNPVAVLVNKGMVEIPPKFANQPPVNPEWRMKNDSEKMGRKWNGAQGLAEDVRYYGGWMRDEAEKQIGQLYPKVEVTSEMAKMRPDLRPLVGRRLEVITWIWTRTVKSPNPAFRNVDVPLVSTYWLSTKSGREAYVEPVLDQNDYRFEIRVGKPKNPATVQSGTSAGKRSGFRCLMSGTPLSYEYIRNEGSSGRMGVRLMAVVAEGDRGRVYLPPTYEQTASASKAHPQWKPETPLHGKCRVNVSNYGFDTYADLFTARQLVALTTFSDLVQKACDRAKDDALAAGLVPDTTPLRAEGRGSTAYAEAMGLYLAYACDYAANYWSSITTPADGFIRGTFARQALPMTWDFAEAPPFGGTSGNWMGGIEWAAKAIENLPAMSKGVVIQADATVQNLSVDKVISTDPPYYDNIGYADLSDFFYVWLRRSLRHTFPELFTTLAVPKADELVATPYRHASKEAAETFFLDGMTKAMHRLAEQSNPAFPVTIYYAFKQSESDDEAGVASTGWDTFLAAVIEAGFCISGTWPMRTEREGRSIGIGANALASSIILVCRPRGDNIAATTRREFVSILRSELPKALLHLQRSNIAPVDLAQAAIGPGMEIFTRFRKVIGADGNSLSVREALSLINQTLDEVLAEQEGDFDADSRWALSWFEQFGFSQGDFGNAETLSKAKNTSVQGLAEGGILVSKAGKVRLLKPSELPSDWNPKVDNRLTAWEVIHQLIRVLESSGELAAAELIVELGPRAENARELCYRLYAICDRKKRSTEAQSYNALVQSWPEITRLAQKREMDQLAVEQKKSRDTQQSLSF